jgi:hypothetical protein
MIMAGILRHRAFQTSFVIAALFAGWHLAIRAERVDGLAQAAGTTADPFDAAILKAFQWRSIGPLRGDDNRRHDVGPGYRWTAYELVGRRGRGF